VTLYNWLTVGGDPVPDTDSGPVFFSFTIVEWGILGDLLAFFIQSSADFTILGEMTLDDKRMNPVHFGSDPSWIRSGWVICPDRDQFGLSPQNSQNSASLKFVSQTHRIHMPSLSTSTQRSQSRQVLKMLTPHGRTDIWPGEITKGPFIATQLNSTSSWVVLNCVGEVSSDADATQLDWPTSR